MCCVLEVSENGYFNWRKRGVCQRKQDDLQLAERIEDAFHDNRGVYGSPRIHAELKEQGIHIGAKAYRPAHATTETHREEKEAHSTKNRQYSSVSIGSKPSQAGFYNGCSQSNWQA